jgi:hypothetical protein
MKIVNRFMGSGHQEANCGHTVGTTGRRLEGQAASSLSGVL